MLRGVSRLLPFAQPPVFASNLASHSASFHTTLKGSADPELDDSYKQLLEDVNFSFNLHQKHSPLAECAQIGDENDSETLLTNGSLVQADFGHSEPTKSTQWKRKSAEARFGSDRIGQFKLPFELVSSMQLLIDGM